MNFIRYLLCVFILLAMPLSKNDCIDAGEAHGWAWIKRDGEDLHDKAQFDWVCGRCGEIKRIYHDNMKHFGVKRHKCTKVSSQAINNINAVHHIPLPKSVGRPQSMDANACNTLVVHRGLHGWVCMKVRPWLLGPKSV